MAHRKYQEADGRDVGLGGLLGSAYGYVGTSIYVVLGGVALYALGVTPIVLLLVGVALIFTAWSYAEASASMPEASGVTSFARRTFGPLPGFVAAWALLLDSIVLVAIIAACIPHYLSVFWPLLQDRPYSVACGIGIVALVILLNVLGLRESVRLSVLVTVLSLATLVLLITVGFLAELRPDVVAAADLHRDGPDVVAGWSSRCRSRRPRSSASTRSRAGPRAPCARPATCRASSTSSCR